MYLEFVTILHLQASDQSESWRKYLSFVDEVVVDGLLRQCASSLGYLIDETDPSITEGILVEVKLELAEPDVIFQGLNSIKKLIWEILLKKWLEV